VDGLLLAQPARIRAHGRRARTPRGSRSVRGGRNDALEFRAMRAAAALAIVSALPLAYVAGVREVINDVDWPTNGGPGNSRYSPLADITRSNVRRLEVAWTYDSHDAFKGSEMQSNPIVVGGVLYATTPTLQVVAIAADSGRELWKFDPGAGAGSRGRFRHRGVTVAGDRVFVTYRSYLWALDR